MKILENVPISSLTTMRLGGPARYVIEIEKPEEVPEAYEYVRSYIGLPVFVLGGGANTIGHDEGFNGAILINKMRGMELKEIDNTGHFLLRAMGGETWDNIVEYACQNALTGIEAMSKIPGTAGAAPVQNIGAYGQDISQVLESIEVFDRKDNKFKILSNEQLCFEYRKSILNTTEYGRFFVVSITLHLKHGQMQRPFYNSLEKFVVDNNETDFSPLAIRRMVSTIRAGKLPDPATTPSAGSFFKNVYVDDRDADRLERLGVKVYRSANGNHKVNTGLLIEKSGLAGKLIHGFRVNEGAALVLINESATSFNDLVLARTEITNLIYDRFGLKLEQEPMEIF